MLADARVDFRGPHKASDYDGRIIECTYDMEERVWVRFRVGVWGGASACMLMSTIGAVDMSIRCLDQPRRLATRVLRLFPPPCPCPRSPCDGSPAAGRLQVFLRERTDKDTPNAVNTYNKVWQSILDNITVRAARGGPEGSMHPSGVRDGGVQAASF